MSSQFSSKRIFYVSEVLVRYACTLRDDRLDGLLLFHRKCPLLWYSIRVSHPLMTFSKCCLNYRRTVKRVSLLVFKSSLQNNLFYSKAVTSHRSSSGSTQFLSAFTCSLRNLCFYCSCVDFYYVLQMNSFKF